MFKFDRVNSSMLCMIRGKLCITIATAFTVTMATHLFLFMLFVDQQLIHGASSRQHNAAAAFSSSEFSPRFKSTVVKRDVHTAPNELSSEMPRLRDNQSNINIVISKDIINKETDMNIARKILGNPAESTVGEGSVDDWWLGKAFQALKQRLTDTPPALSSSAEGEQARTLDNDSQKVMAEGNNVINKKVGEEDSKEYEIEMHIFNRQLSDDTVLPNAHSMKEVIVQEINIPPAKQDDEWEPQDDWNMEHLIVAETKKALPNTRKVHKEPDNNKKADKVKTVSTKLKPANITGTNQVKEFHVAEEKYIQNRGSYNSRNDNVVRNKNVPQVKQQQQKPSSGKTLKDSQLQGQGYSDASSSQRRRLPVQTADSDTSPRGASKAQYNTNGSPQKTVMGTLVKSRTKTISVVPKPLDTQPQRSDRVVDRLQYRVANRRDVRHQSEFGLDPIQHNFNELYKQGINVPPSDYNNNNINTRGQQRNAVQDSVPVASNIQEGRKTSILTQQDIQRLHNNYVQRRSRQ